MDPRLDISDFNDKGELKTPLGLLLCLVFLSRHLLFLLLGGLSEFLSRGGGFNVSDLGLPPAWSLWLDLPVFGFLLLVLRKDKLPAGGWFRALLRRGVPLLLGLAAAQLALLIVFDFVRVRDPGLLRMADVVLMVVCLFYLASDYKVKFFFKTYGS